MGAVSESEDRELRGAQTDMRDLAKRHQNTKIVDAEIVGDEPPPPFWHRIASRLVFSLVLGGVGLCAIILGAILTITIVGAVAGIPMVLLGLSLVLVAIIVGLGGGRFITIRGTDE